MNLKFNILLFIFIHYLIHYSYYNYIYVNNVLNNDTCYTIGENIDSINTQVILGNNLKNITYNMVVDTGADVVYIPKNIALNLNIFTNCNTVESITANGIRKGCLITIPKIYIKGCYLENVKALTSNNYKITDSGLLGMSFLNNFDLHFYKLNKAVICC